MTIIDNSRVFAATEVSTLYHNDERSIGEKYGQFCAPYFKIEISDKDDNRLFSADTLINNGGFDLNGLIIESVSYEEDIDGAAVINLNINNPTLELVNSALFKEGNNIDIWMGYDGRTPFYMNRGIIVEVAPDFPSDGMPTIKLTSYDIAYFMMEEGKGEIVPEGSAWWQRSRVTSSAIEPRPSTYNDSWPEEDPNSEDMANRQRTAMLAGEQDQDVMPRMEGFESAQDDGWAPSQTEIRQGQVTDPEDRFNAAQRNTRTAWQQQSFGRRRRNSGKVWKNLTDAEIVAKIFLSYGVTPYVEATREHVRRSTNRNREEEIVIEDMREVPFTVAATVNGIRRMPVLTEAEFAEESRLERERIQASNTETLERARSRLNTEEFNNLTSIINGNIEIGSIEDQFGRPINRFRSARINGVRYLPLDIPDDTPPQPAAGGGDRNVTQKSGTTDWQFIKELADKHGYIVFVFFHIESRRWIGYWGPENQVPQFREYIFQYNAGDLTTLGNVKPSTSTKSQSSEIDLLFVDPVTRRENRLRVSMDNLSSYTDEFRGASGPTAVNEPLGDGPEVVLRIHGQRVRVNANHRFTSAEDARIWLMSFWLAHANDFALLEGNTIVGIPEMRAREHHHFEGLLRYSDKYFVTQSKHSMSPTSMYQTEFTARRITRFAPGDENTDLMTVDQSDLGTHNADTTERGIVL